MSETIPPCSPRPGLHLGPYVLQGPLGQGGMGQVFAAVNEHIGQEVAIKILGAAAAHPAAQARLLQEGRALAQLAHPGIVRVLTCDCTAEGMVYLVMERVTGITLRQWLRERPGPRPWSQVVALGTQVAAAMAVAHQHGIVHRDLTPTNIMLTPLQGQPAALRATVLDFGIAKVTAPAASLGEHTVLQTGEGGFLGTPGYAAPEQHGAAAVSEDRADVYGLGVVLYECLAGGPPFSGDGVEALLLSRTAPPPPLGGEVPPALAGLIEAMLASNAQQRPMMQQVHDALSAVAARRLRGWPAVLQVGVLATLAVLLIGGALAFYQHQRAPRAVGAPVSDPQKEALLQQVLFDTQRWLSDADWGLAQLPNTLQERQRVLARYDATLSALDVAARARPAVLRSAIEIRHRAGDLALYHGPLAAALDDYRVALSQIERALLWTPSDPELLLLKALNHSKQGKALAALGQARDAALLFDASVALLRQTFGGHPPDPEVRRVLSVSLQEVGELAVREGRGAVQVLRDAEALLAESGDDYDGWRCAEASLWLGLALPSGPEAEAVLRRALTEQRQRSQRQPANLMFRATQGHLLAGLGALHLAQGSLAEAGREIGGALALVRAVSAAEPTDKRHALLRCEVLVSQALLALRQRSPAQAFRAREECRTLADAFALRDPRDTRFQRSVARFPVP